ncbi:Plasmid Maintenance Protein containing protein [Brugia malayi]|uniref:Mannosyltransferase n=3 Tax=Brugia malayi TaxID=6279 RepID=A0A4E9FF66_BRUMA|nr:Plasmid Maintenance Protein containing protein [Brugia malayi]VIO95102.1 Plasmid Maintenance Protein containing protein [Brugia malayi]
MTKKNMSLVKRTSNRIVIRSRLSPTDNVAADEQPSALSPLQANVLWNYPALDSFSKLYIPGGQMDLEWQPSVASIFKIVFSVRISAAMWSIISDCDEVYNYWEPLHLFLYGTGFQTWEYSPVYAIRSYLYILMHYGPAAILKTIFFANKSSVFITMRCVLGLFNVGAEIKMYKALCSRFGNGIARIYVVLTSLSAGMFIASCAFLPSSFSMSANLFAIAAYINEEWLLAISFTAVSALVSWPFAAILGLPIVLEMLVVRPRELAFTFCNYALIAGSTIVIALVTVDAYYFGKIVLAPLNIVLYNVFSSHGPNLYGIEDVKFYIKNLLLNWNVIIILFPFSVPFAGLAYVLTRSSRQLVHCIAREMSLVYWRRFLPVLFIFLSVMLWFAVFFLQPHKEERFLFPVYPLLAVLAAVTLDALPRVGIYLLGGRSRSFWQACVIGWLMIFSVMSVSRSAALYRNFFSPVELYKVLDKHMLNYTNHNELFSAENNSMVIHICIGKEWYRFPSSFFLPSGIKNKKNQVLVAELNFIKSEFTGLLPKPYMKGFLPEVTRVIPTDMNDLNREEISRYIDIGQCDFLIDLETLDTTVLEPNYAEQTNIWRSVVKKKFLLSSYSHPVYRSFYIPFITGSNNVYGNYHLLERIHNVHDNTKS